MKNYYLIDFENVNEEGLNGIFDLDESAFIYLFYTEKSLKISLDFLNDLLLKGLKASLTLFKVPAGKQSLDSHIHSYLGYLIGLKEDAKYYIVSKDKGYSKIIDFWNYNLNSEIVYSYTSINLKMEADAKVIEVKTDDKVKIKVEPPKKKPVTKVEIKKPSKALDKTSLNNSIQTVLSKQKYENEVISFVAKTATKNFNQESPKKEIYQSIIKEYGQKKGLEIYNLIKVLL